MNAEQLGNLTLRTASSRKSASSGVKEREPVEIEYQVVTGATVGCERLVAHATQLFHPLADRVAFNLEHVAVASVRQRKV
jgi:hypothetical protein